MEIFDDDSQHTKIKAAVILQNSIRNMRNKIMEYNSEMKNNYLHIINIISRIQDKYDVGLLTKDKYINEMEKAELILNKINNKNE